MEVEEVVEEVANAPTLHAQLQNVRNTLQLRAVWRPMIFMYTYYVLQIPNSAWTNSLNAGLEFSDFEIGLITI